MYNRDMLTHKEIIEDILSSEGSIYTNRPNDYGGPTKYGITIPAFKRFLGRDDIDASDIQSINKTTAIDFYEWLFVEDKVVKLPEIMQHAFFDSCVLDGYGGASGFLQEALIELGQPVKLDYDAGPKTFEAVKCVVPKVLFNKFLDKRAEYYNHRADTDPSQEENRQGWLNRIERLRKNG